MRNRIIKEGIDIFGNKIEEGKPIRRKYIEPPFSVIDTKTGDWQKRKKEWARLGIKSELGRNDNYMGGTHSLTGEKYGGKEKMASESIFDPALCEVSYNWFCPDGGRLLDPFAGGSVRGIVAEYLGYRYTGIDIRPEQVESNREQASKISNINPNWIIGDSNKILDDQSLGFFDMLFSCPPYADLEVYSDMEGDISNMPYKNFLEVYRSIIKKSCDKLFPSAFAVWVVGEVRDKKTGEYYGFVPDTIQAFKDAGMLYYNEGIILNAIGTAMMRIGNTFERGDKKLVKVHQNYLVFKKPEETFNFEL